MDALVFISAILIGLSLGVFGSGGAILTLPSLIYLLGYSEKLAVITSLFIVGFISLFSSFRSIYERTISLSHLTYFAAPSVITSYIGGAVGAQTSDWVQLSVFILLMLLAAIKLLFSSNANLRQKQTSPPYGLAIAGAVVGFFTGFVGVGGGFLIVPALMFMTNMSLIKASATSLIIISVQAFSGVLAYSQVSPTLFSNLNVVHIATFSTVGIAGALAGSWIKHKLNQQKLSKIFAYFLLVVACSIFVERVWT